MRATGRYVSVAFCLLVMAGIATWVLTRWGFTPAAAIIVAFAVSCPVAMLYAWWLGRRALKPLNRAARADARRTP